MLYVYGTILYDVLSYMDRLTDLMRKKKGLVYGTRYQLGFPLADPEKMLDFNSGNCRCNGDYCRYFC